MMFKFQTKIVFLSVALAFSIGASATASANEKKECYQRDAHSGVEENGYFSILGDNLEAPEASYSNVACGKETTARAEVSVKVKPILEYKRRYAQRVPILLGVYR